MRALSVADTEQQHQRNLVLVEPALSFADKSYFQFKIGQSNGNISIGFVNQRKVNYKIDINNFYLSDAYFVDSEGLVRSSEQQAPQKSDFLFRIGDVLVLMFDPKKKKLVIKNLSQNLKQVTIEAKQMVPKDNEWFIAVALQKLGDFIDLEKTSQ